MKDCDMLENILCLHHLGQHVSTKDNLDKKFNTKCEDVSNIYYV